MKAYLLKIFGVFIIAGTGEILLPEGNIKKYAKVLLSLLICHALLSPAGVIPDFSVASSVNETNITDTFKDDVMAEYRRKIEENIFEETGDRCRVFLDSEGQIEKITAEKISGSGMLYITGELGVEENDIEIGKN